jgi:factor associated with neutral sphingomyelinase activation
MRSAIACRHDFLLNSLGLGLGTRQSGRPVGDVELPPWAADAPHFQAVHRAALEAPFVSANLYHWLDLVFGCKQQGEAAVEADNVFRHTAYEGAVDIEAVTDRTERLALETQIAEFGQCPRQLFRHSHPQRLVCPSVEVPATEPAGAHLQQGEAGGGGIGGGSGQTLALVSAILALVSAGQGPGESPRVEVPAQLAELDVLAARRRQQAADAADAAAAAAEVAEAAAATSDRAEQTGGV